MQITLELRKTSHRDADPSGSTCLVRHWKAWHSKHTAPRRGGAYEWGVTGATGVSTTQNGFAMAAGGGLDINVGKHLP
jgi:hypothetical protein